MFEIKTAEKIETIVLSFLRGQQSWVGSGAFGSISRVGGSAYVVECEGQSFAVVCTATQVNGGCWQIGCNGKIGRGDLIEAATMAISKGESA